MEMKTDPCFEAEDDDVFYAELRRQILLLTVEDEDDDENAVLSDNRHDLGTGGGGAKQGAGGSGQPAAGLPGSYFGWSEIAENRNAVPTWLVNLWRRPGNGTGVFIPHIAKSRRRRPKSARRNNAQGTTYKQVANEYA